jgi:hypothetical protein
MGKSNEVNITWYDNGIHHRGFYMEGTHMTYDIDGEEEI